MAELSKIVHLGHNGLPFGEESPNGLNFSIQLNQTETIQYTLDLNSILANEAYTQSDITDFIYYYKGKPLLGGIHTEVDIENVDDGTMQVAGKGWSQYLDQRWWPPTKPDGTDNDPYSATNKDVVFIAEELIDYVTWFESPVSLQIYHNNAASGYTVDYDIDITDRTSILGHVQTLSKLISGFDFEITWDRWFKTYSPRKGSVRSYVFEQGINCNPISYRNPGNGGNYFFGTGSDGDSGDDFTSFTKNGADIATRRRKDITVDFGQVGFQEMLDFKTQAEAARQVLPLVQMSFEWLGDDRIANIFDEVSIGDTVKVRGDTEYHHVDDFYRIVGIEGNPTDEGDERITFTFDDGSLSL